MSIYELRAHRGKGYLLPHRHIGRAADHGHLLGPQVHGGQAEAVGVGVGRDIDHLRNSDFVPVAGGGDDLSHLVAGHGQALGQLLRANGYVNVLRQPLERYSHGLPQNCRRNRRSLEWKSRMSSIPWRIMAMRSTPMPKAKPV